MPRRKQTIWLLVFVFAIAALFFRKVLPLGQSLFTIDVNIGGVMAAKGWYPEAYTGSFLSYPLFGSSSIRPLTFTSLLNWWCPVEIFSDWIYAFYLALSSVFLILFLHRRGIRSPIAIMFAVLSAYWAGSNLTLLYAGHLGKFGVLMFASLALYAIEMNAQTRNIFWSLIAGGAVGLMFIEQQDLALFMGLFLGLYTLFRTWQTTERRVKGWMARLVPMVLMIACVAGPGSMRVYRSNAAITTGESATRDNIEQWQFCTQWSHPPAECVDFILPGFMGFRSQDPDSPYWGKTGRDARWQLDKQGFRNFRLESIYVGIIPCIFAIFALLVGIRSPRNGKACKHKADILFWGITALLALSLSFGKYFSLYRLFYELPVVSSIRNPNKFLQVFQISVAILAAFGLELVLQRQERSTMNHGNNDVSVLRQYTGVTAGLLLATAIIALLVQPPIVQQFKVSGWGTYCEPLTNNMIRALARSGGLALIATIFLYAEFWNGLNKSTVLQHTVATFLIGLSVLDYAVVSARYIKPVDVKSAAGTNPVISFLKSNLGEQRVALLSQAGFYNSWNGSLFPAHDIPCVNIFQMRNFRPKVLEFMTTVGHNPLRMWQLTSVAYVLGPAQVWSSMRNDPQLRQRFQPVFGFNAYPSRTGVRIKTAQPGQPVQHMILKYLPGLPRLSLVRSWKVVPDDETCRMLAAPSFDPTKLVLVSKDTANGLTDSSNVDPRGNITIMEKSPKAITVMATTKNESMLLFSQSYSPDWKVSVEGIPQHLYRCNQLCMGVIVKSGQHKVTFKYAPECITVWIQCVGMLIFVAAIVALAIPVSRFSPNRKMPGPKG